MSMNNPAYIFTFFLLIVVLPIYLLLITTRKTNYKKLPPGSWGLPFLGQSLSIVHAMRTNTAERWLQERVRKYGPVSKFNFLGTPTVFLHGQAANKLIYTNGGDTFANQQPNSVRRIMGERNIMELSGNEHKRVRGGLVSFLKPEVLKLYVGKMDEEVRKHLEMHWHGKEQVQVMPLMKTLTFNIMNSLIIGIEQGARRDTLVELFQHIIDGLLSIPVNLPFTRFNRSLRASAKVRATLRELIREKREAMKQHSADAANKDLISCLLTIRNEDNSILLSDEELIDNAIVIMVAGHDTSSVLITFIIRLLANDPSVYATVLQEQEEIAKSKAPGELLTWEDLAKMKYTWRVAIEILRMTPPVFCSFRTVLRDFEYEGYIIPKGWQVMWAACMTQMDEKIFPDPSKFDATRFEKQAPSPPPPFSFVAFGGGSRMCPGNEFARIETLVTIHYLVTKFTWKLSCRDNSFFRDPMPVFKHGLPIQIKPKKD
ncbi:hypothetical protein ACOSQ4_013140 [Xanthoceras sorbifolium]